MAVHCTCRDTTFISAGHRHMGRRKRIESSAVASWYTLLNISITQQSAFRPASTSTSRARSRRFLVNVNFENESSQIKPLQFTARLSMRL